ncbi:MAG: helix-turn-helix domain-containing protein [Chloroflexi bacterium]|nr:helix-turn-helix domain-containing protein [Chloroflexota bacterium]
MERNSSRRCWSATAENSWFSIRGTSAPKRKSLPTSSPSSRYSGPGSTVCGDTVRKSRKIRLYPDAAQRSELRRWFGAARYAYNQTVELLTGEDAPPAVKTKVRDLVLPMLPSGTGAHRVRCWWALSSMPAAQ